MNKHGSFLFIFSMVSFIMSGCATTAPLLAEAYQPSPATSSQFEPLKGTFLANSVTGETRVQADSLIRGSLPCRLTTFQMPGGVIVSDYILHALRDELSTAGRLAPDGRKIDVVVNAIESDTQKETGGTWTLDFTYKLGRLTKAIQTVTTYETAEDGEKACRDTADAFNDALRANFTKFFEALGGH